MFNFENIVFAGGGNRCFWQAGFWKIIENHFESQPKQIASVSAGSAISCALFSNKFEQIYEKTLQVVTDNRKNRYWKNLFNEQPVHPHNVLYRYIIESSISESDLITLKSGPCNNILVAHIPSYLGPKTSTLIGLTAYQLEKKLFHPVHPSFGKALGFRSEFIPVQECETVKDLIEIIISSSCTPPFTPLMYRHGKPVLDGGMIDNVPVHGITNPSGKTLVLCSRPYNQFPQIKNMIYVCPSKKVSVSSWDYTNPQAIRETFEQGRKDGEVFLRTYTVS